MSETDLERARRAAAMLRAIAPDKAAEIERAILEFLSGQRDRIKVDIGVKYRLEKFNGEYEPGMTPVEIVEGLDAF